MRLVSERSAYRVHLEGSQARAERQRDKGRMAPNAQEKLRGRALRAGGTRCLAAGKLGHSANRYLKERTPCPLQPSNQTNSTTLASSSPQLANAHLAQKILGPYPVRCSTTNNPRITRRRQDSPQISQHQGGNQCRIWSVIEARVIASEAFIGPLGKSPFLILKCDTCSSQKARLQGTFYNAIAERPISYKILYHRTIRKDNTQLHRNRLHRLSP